MVADDTTDARFTAMSLAVGKDSGWYEIDLSLGENFFWGKGEGCKIFENTCDHATVTEFCNDESKRGCSDNHMYTTSCDSSTFSGSCNINLNVKSCKTNHTPSIDAFTYGTSSLCLAGEVGFIFHCL